MYGPFLVALVVALVIPAAYGQENIALNQPTWQSSIGFEGESARGVDGDANSDYFDLSCTHTNNEDHAWWAVDLGQEYFIGRVDVTNRVDCCTDRLSNYIVAVTNNEPPVGDNSDLDSMDQCGQYIGEPPEQSSITCPAGTRGRYVYIFLPSPGNFLTLCEVEVYRAASVALNQPTWQSSTDFSGEAARGVDGDRNSDYFDLSCTHTENEDHAWWAVDLGQRYTVIQVDVTNRVDCCDSRLSNYIVAVSDEEPPVTDTADLDGFDQCGQFDGLPPEHSSITCAEGVAGRYLYVYLPSPGNFLTLCEVMVFGGEANVGLNQPTWQSSIGFNGDSARGVDGNNNSDYFNEPPSCTHTQNEDHAWWAVDLGQRFDVQRVEVTNRVDCCDDRLSNYIVAVTDEEPPLDSNADLDGYSQCGQYDGLPPESSVVACAADTVGRYLYVYLPSPGNYLTLCEVEIFGNRV